MIGSGLTGTVISQDTEKDNIHPNISGIWDLDTKSLSKKEASAISGYILTIEHSKDELKMSREYTESGRLSKYTETIYTDSRNEKNIDLYGISRWNRQSGGLISSISKWKRVHLIVRRFDYDKGSVGMAYLIDTQKIEISEDGSTLTITTEYQPNTNPRSGINPVSKPLIVSTISKALRFIKRADSNQSKNPN